MSLVQFGSYLSQNFTSGITTAHLSGGTTVEGYTSDNGGEFSFRILYEDGTVSMPKTVTMTDEDIEAFVGHDTFNLAGTVVALTGGGFAVVVRCDGTDIFARTYDANGNATSSLVRVTDASSDRFLTSATATADGGFTVNWSDNVNYSEHIAFGGGDPDALRSTDNWARHFSSTCVPAAGGAFLAQASNPTTQLADPQYNGDCVGLTNGKTAYVYIDEHRSTNDVHSVFWANNAVSLYLNGNEIRCDDNPDIANPPDPVMSAAPRIVQLSNGNIAVAWLEHGTGNFEWHGRIFKQNGTAVTNDIVLDSATGQSNATFMMVAMDNGKFALLQTFLDPDGTNDVKLTTYDSLGVQQSFGFVSILPGHQTVSDLSYIGDSGLLVTYTDQNDPNFATRSTVIVEPGTGQIVTTGNGSAEVMTGGNKADWLDGKGGNDTLNGNNGNDHLFGGSADDVIDGGGNDDHLFGGNGRDHLAAGTGNNVLVGGDGNDRINLTGGGADIVVIAAASESTQRAYDTVIAFDFAADKFDLTVAVTEIDATITTGNLKKNHFDDKLAAAVDDAHLGAHHAVVFTPDSGTYAGDTLLIIDANGLDGYQAGQDIVVLLDTPANVAGIDIGDFM